MGRLKSAEEQLVLVSEMHIEGGPAYVCAVQNFLDRNGFIFFLENERHQSLVQQPSCSLDTAILAFFPHRVPFRAFTEQIAAFCSETDNLGCVVLSAQCPALYLRKCTYVHFRMTVLENNMSKQSGQTAELSTPGIVLHRALLYDACVWLASLGRERTYREKALDLAGLRAGESVLDIGCGTGTLAIAAKRRVGPQGKVSGIDASPEMLRRARKKAEKTGAEVTFKNGIVEALPFPDRQFDAVLSTVMLHHLGRGARQKCAEEVQRVLKPGGRVLAVDFARPATGKKGFLDHFDHHGYVSLDDMIALFARAGLNITQKGPVGMGDLHFVIASAPHSNKIVGAGNE
jgi:ubiquinone/menaquinone biosynthesis C-methylase UbiE